MPVTTEVPVEEVVSLEESKPEIEAKANSNDRQNHVISNIDLNTESESLIEPEKDSEAEFKALNTKEDKITTVNTT
ncbi:MAG TPA: hypothetical protein DDZ41_06570 [Flavobacterium sp.]|nr:hypothetical protein [Flavobacterium sp.]